MTTLGSSSSTPESSMEDASNSPHNRPSRRRHNNKDRHRNGADDDGADPEVWGSFDRSFQQVQSVLDRNRVLIQQVNDNHQSRMPDNMVKNVALIQEINGNISKVVSLYSDLNSNFSTACHQRSKNGTAMEKNSSDS